MIELVGGCLGFFAMRKGTKSVHRSKQEDGTKITDQGLTASFTEGEERYSIDRGGGEEKMRKKKEK